MTNRAIINRYIHHSTLFFLKMWIISIQQMLLAKLMAHNTLTFYTVFLQRTITNIAGKKRWGKPDNARIYNYLG
jgi:hypothetical protein